MCISILAGGMLTCASMMSVAVVRSAPVIAVTAMRWTDSSHFVTPTYPEVGASVMCKLPLLCLVDIFLMCVQTISTTGCTGRSTVSCLTTKRYAHTHPGLPACVPPAPIVHVAMCHQPPPRPPHTALPCPIKQPLQHLKQCKSPLMPLQTRPHHSPLPCHRCASSSTHRAVSSAPTHPRLSYHAQIRLGGAIARQKGRHEYILCHGCQLFLSLWLPLFIYRIWSMCLSPTTQKL